MTALRTIIHVAPDGTISGHAPPGVPPGDHAIEIDLADIPPGPTDAWDFPVDDLGPWPQGLSLRREDLYGDDGR